MTKTEKTHLEQLKEQEDKLFTRRDEMEKQVNTAAGRELSSLEFQIIRQAIAEFEECERRIDKIQERMNDVREWESE
jgi:hypothetical protein